MKLDTLVIQEMRDSGWFELIYLKHFGSKLILELCQE